MKVLKPLLRHKHYVVEDIYRLTKGLDCEYKTFSEVIRRFHKKVVERCVLLNEIVKLPCRMGTIQILKSKVKIGTKRMRVDFKATKEYGTTIYHLNEHSNGNYYFFKWKRGKIKEIMFWKLTVSRISKKFLSNTITNQKIQY